jgi:L-arabinonolactonase
MQVEHVVSVGNQLGEGPIWHAGEAALYWVDIHRLAIYCYVPSTGQIQHVSLPLVVSFLLFGEDDTALVGTPDGLALWERETNTLRLLADNSAYQPTGRFNDAAVDLQGRIWAGTMSQTPTNHLYRVDHDGVVTMQQDGLGIANGLGWTADSRTMYHVDSAQNTIYRYVFDPETGTINQRVPFFVSPASFGTPDGLTMDAEDHLWCAFWDGWKVARITPTGEVVTVIDMPVQRPTSCAFGGAAGDDLYITSAIDDLNNISDQPQAGDLFRVKVPVKGQPQRRYTVKGIR